MLYRGLLATALSGSVSALVASHNRGGPYFRNRSTPTNPNSAFQQDVRAIVSNLSQRWGSTLTGTQRTNWGTYGENVPWQNALGETIFLTGLNWYIKCNTPRVQAGLSIVDAAPTSFSLAELTTPITVVPDLSSQNAAVTFDNGDLWASQPTGALLVYMSRPQNPTVNFYKGPYRLAAAILGNETPPTSPQTISTLPFPVTALGQRVFFQTFAVQMDGRVSAYFRDFGAVVA